MYVVSKNIKISNFQFLHLKKIICILHGPVFGMPRYVKIKMTSSSPLYGSDHFSFSPHFMYIVHTCIFEPLPRRFLRVLTVNILSENIKKKFFFFFSMKFSKLTFMDKIVRSD